MKQKQETCLVSNICPRHKKHAAAVSAAAGGPGSNAVLWFWHLFTMACVHCMHGAVACSECAALEKVISAMPDDSQVP